MSAHMKLSGHTVPYAVLGHPIGHTLSPVMHNAAFKSLGLDAIYLAFDVAPENLMEVLPSMASMGFRGVNLTVPLKEVAFRGIEDLGDSARRLGAVNTVEILANGSLRGHNTDGDGFLLAIEEAFGLSVKGRSVFVLGSGGAGRAVAITCAAAGASSLAVADMDEARATALAEEIRGQNPATVANPVEDSAEAWMAAARGADLVVQATPVGMKRDDPSLLPAEAFRKGQALYDLVYMYPETAAMREARSAGADAANGLGMLLHQGASAFTIWTGTPAATGVMRLALETEVYGESEHA